MQDDYLTEPRRPAPRSRIGGRFLAAALAGTLVLGAAGALWAGSELGWVDFNRSSPAASAVAAPRPALAAGAPAMRAPEQAAQVALGVRVAELEQRLTQIGLDATAAAGNAARAEGLLIAFAARRSIERGDPLGYLEPQLKLRFGNAQPNAVATLTATASNPVTLDILEQGLHALEPALARAPREEDAWDRVQREFANLFVIRRVGAPSPAPERRLERARMFLETGRVNAAIGEVERMPGRAAAREWLALARRYVRAQAALDLIETAAILEPRELQDGAGAPVTIASPLATPTGSTQGTF